MKVKNQFIVTINGHWHIVYECHTINAGEQSIWFTTTNGAFGQRETYIEKITSEEAHELIDKWQTVKH